MTDNTQLQTAIECLNWCLQDNVTPETGPLFWEHLRVVVAAAEQTLSSPPADACECGFRDVVCAECGSPVKPSRKPTPKPNKTNVIGQSPVISDSSPANGRSCLDLYGTGSVERSVSRSRVNERKRMTTKAPTPPPDDRHGCNRPVSPPPPRKSNPSQSRAEHGDATDDNAATVSETRPVNTGVRDATAIVREWMDALEAMDDRSGLLEAARVVVSAAEGTTVSTPSVSRGESVGVLHSVKTTCEVLSSAARSSSKAHTKPNVLYYDMGYADGLTEAANQLQFAIDDVVSRSDAGRPSPG